MAEDVGRQDARRQRDRERMRRVIAEHGFGHAIDSVANAVAVEVVSAVPTATLDERMDQFAQTAETAMLDALVLIARLRGWRGGTA